MKLQIKNMVCDRCKRVVSEELNKIGVVLTRIELGEVEMAETPDTEKMKVIKAVLEQNGFELLDDRKDALVETNQNADY